VRDDPNWIKDGLECGCDILIFFLFLGGVHFCGAVFFIAFVSGVDFYLRRLRIE